MQNLLQKYKVIKLDLKNAFNSLPHNAIKGYCIPELSKLNAAYLTKQLQMRHSKLVKTFDTGVPQGCPLSPLLFAGTIDHILTKLKHNDKVVDVIAFADDVIIVYKEGAS